MTYCLNFTNKKMEEAKYKHRRINYAGALYGSTVSTWNIPIFDYLTTNTDVNYRVLSHTNHLSQDTTHNTDHYDSGSHIYDSGSHCGSTDY